MHNTIECFGNMSGIKPNFDFFKARTGNMNEDEYNKLLEYVDKIIYYFNDFELCNTNKS